jgi:hypothetical protein
MRRLKIFAKIQKKSIDKLKKLCYNKATIKQTKEVIKNEENHLQRMEQNWQI